MFFFGKKNQKTFIRWSLGSDSGLPGIKRFFASFCSQKEDLLPFALIFAIVALVSQLSLGAMVLPQAQPADPLAALARLSLLCKPGETPRRAPPLPVPALHAVLTLPAMVPAPMVAPPQPVRRVALVPRLVMETRAPISRVPMAAYPRGPPGPG